MSGWTWLEDLEELECAAGCAGEARCNVCREEEGVEEELNALAAEHGSLTSERERRGWQAESDREEGRDYGPDDDDEPGICARVAARERVRLLREEAQLSAIEDRIHELGARLCRPYEHWNEDEAFMEWSERER